MKSYRANWELQGLPGMRALPPGGVVKLDPEDAAPLVGCGVLSLCEAGSPPIADEVDLGEMNKAQLVEYGREQFGLALDVNRKKDELLAAIAAAGER